MRTCFRSSLTALVIAGLALPACAIDENSNPTPRCETDAECTGGRVCYRNYCILGGTIDGGDMDAGGDTAGCDGVSDEICNGLDDNCDGTIDNITTTTCANGEAGVCATAHLVCPSDGGATPVCRRDTPPIAETCNGRDDDCDGETDEQSSQRCYPDGELGCTLVAGRYICRGACGAGIQACIDGEYGDCEQARLPGAEVCTTGTDVAGDEDCDEMIDEDCACTAGTSCFPGDIRQAGLGECGVGTLNCATHACMGFGMPSDETCGNPDEDNDCDGVGDNVPGTNVPCLNDEAIGVCHTGVTQCVEGGAVECVTPMSMTETCDGTDDDCDGMVDEMFDTTSDEANCGGCGNACEDGLTCCGGLCVDGRSNDMFCGGTVGTCGADCADGSACCGGACTDPLNDGANCGGCGVSCGSGACCNGACVDDGFDELNCGGCGTECDGGTPDCCSGTCSPDSTCDVCDPTCEGDLSCCGGACYDMDNDELNCGGCGVTCDAGDVCCDGACVDSDPDHCGGSCTDCGPVGLCCGGSCVPDNFQNCTACGLVCGSGTACCVDGCRPLNTTANCGACGTSCDTGELCSVGHCCPSGSAWCGTACVPLGTASNCRTCGEVCGFLTHCDATRGCVVL